MSETRVVREMLHSEEQPNNYAEKNYELKKRGSLTKKLVS
jgi:hypothetical protein